MRKPSCFLVVILLFLVIISCRKEEEIIAPFLNLSPSSLHMGANGEGENQFDIESNVEWNVRTGVDWLKLSQMSGKGNASLKVTAEGNPEDKKRIASIVVTAGNISKDIWVYQNCDTLTITPNSMTLNYMAGSTGEIYFSTSQKWVISGVPEWLVLSALSGTGDAKITVTTKENSGERSRTANLIITAGAKVGSVQITQQFDKLTVTPSLKIGYAKNSTGKIDIQTGKQWDISGIPEWLKLSTQSGTGNTTITATSLTENMDSQMRSATLIVEAGNQRAEVIVEQSGGMSVSISDRILLSNGYWCKYVFGGGVSGYAALLLDEDYFDTFTSEEAVQQLVEQEGASNISEKEALFTGLSSQKKFVHCIVPYTMNNGVKKWGEMLTYRFTTPSSTASAGVSIGSISYLNNSVNNYWRFRITSSSYYYYLAVYKNSDAVDLYTNVPPIFFAMAMYQNPTNFRTQMTGDLMLPFYSYDYALLLVAWGGPQYGNIAIRYKNNNYLYAPNLSLDASSMTQQQFHRGSMEERKQWEKEFKSCHIIKVQ